MTCASLIGAALAVSFPLEWNATHDSTVPYEVEIAPAKLGIGGSGRYAVRADGKDIRPSLLPGKFDGTVRLRFSVPQGTKSLSCSAQSGGEVPLEGKVDGDMFGKALSSADGWSMDRVLRRVGDNAPYQAGGIEFVLKSGTGRVSYEADVPPACAGRDVQFEIEVENIGAFPSPSNIFIDQYDAAGRLLAETVSDHRWTSHLRPPRMKQRMVNPGRIHPEARKVRLVITMSASSAKWDEYGEALADGADTSARLRVTRLSLRPGALLTFPKYADCNFASGVSGREGDCALRLGGENCNAVWYQTRSWASWAKSRVRNGAGTELRDERLVFFPSKAGTCEAWFKPEWAATQKAAVHLFSGKRHKSTVGIKEVSEPVFDLTYVPASKRLRLFRMDVAGKKFEGSANVDIPAGEWVHVAVAWTPGDAATVWVAGRQVVRVGLEGFAALDLANAKYPGDEDMMELYLGSESRITRRRETMTPYEGTPLFSGLVDNWRVSTGVRYGGEFSPEKSFAVDGDTRALFTFDRSYSGVSGGGFGWIPLTFYSKKDRVDHRLATGGRAIQYYPDEISAEADPNAVLDSRNYRSLPTAADFRAARRRQTKTFRARPGDKLEFVAASGSVADCVEIANDGSEPLVNPFVVGKGEVDARSYGDIRDSLFGGKRLSPRDRANRVFQFMLSASDYYMTHHAYFPFDGGDRCADVWFESMSVLNSYCGFECGPLNQMTKNVFACSGALPATMTQGYAHSFEQVFYDGKNHVYDLSAQRFFPAFDNVTAAELGEMDDQPGLKTRKYGRTDHFIRNGQRADIADGAPFMRKLGFTLNPGEKFRAWWDNDGEGNDLLCSKQAKCTNIFPDYTDLVHADRKTTSNPVYRSHRYFPHYGNAFFIFDGRPSDGNPAFAKSGGGFAYHVHSPYPVVAAEYHAVRKGGGEARLEISTDRGATYRPLKPGLVRYEVRARYDYWIRVCEPVADISRFFAKTEVQLNARILPGKAKPGKNSFVLKGKGGEAKVTFAWREPAGEIEVGGALHYGAIPGAENSLVVLDPSQGALELPVRGVSAKAAARPVGRGAENVSCVLERGKLKVSAKAGAKGFFAFAVRDGGREKVFDLLVCEGAKAIRAEEFSPEGDAALAKAGGDMANGAVVFGKSGGKASAKCAVKAGRYAVMPLFRAAAGNVDGRFSPRLKIDVGGRTLSCGRPVNSACNYYKAMYGEEGGRANWKWDFPIDPKSSYYLERMLVPELAESDVVTVSHVVAKDGRGEEVEVAAVLLVPDPDFDLHGDLIKTLCGLNTQRGRVR